MVNLSSETFTILEFLTPWLANFSSNRDDLKARLFFCISFFLPRHRVLGVSRWLLTWRSRVWISLNHVLFIQWKSQEQVISWKVWINSSSEMKVGWRQTEGAQRNGEDGIRPRTWGNTEIYNQTSCCAFYCGLIITCLWWMKA